MPINRELIIPLGDLVNHEGNMYELTNAAIHRAEQISMAGSDDLDKNRGKIVSTALEEIISKKVQYEYQK
ncbi:DNA-directed RNA polymerase subunit omega [Oceanispirochaeta sp.]|uniref:DNA-directed RNA polymerase subunit omega n=1 Tax=Oceanispirochaeta sp. TaxID=2035350 RepID=UPI0026262766|nr:DNA-directed RNA polymerase subunit omega [Oceanispirochaeta sp.]MDA3957928.1 DNA-directed RNA polymerase subunit omega [Oceanispirochaeta sp.]